MKRRSLLKSLITAPAAAVALDAQRRTRDSAETPDESPIIESSVPDSVADPVARFFSRDQFSALVRLAELFEPAVGDLPGAREAHAPEFLDFLLSQSPAARQSLYREGLDRLNSQAASRHSKPFAALDNSQAAALLEPLRRPWTYADPSDPLEHFLREVKADIHQATNNSYEFISVASKRSRSANGVGEFWYPIY